MPPRPPLAVLLTTVLLVSAAVVLVVGPVGATPDEPANSAIETCLIGSSDAGGSSAGGSSVSAPADSVSVSTWTAPASASTDLRTAADIRQGIETGLVTPADAGADRHRDESVAVGDVVVHRLRLNGSTDGLLDRLAAQDQGSPTENFRALVQRDDSGVEFRYLGPSACPPRLALNESIDNGSFRVVPDTDHDTLYIVVDVEGLYFQLGQSGPFAGKWNWGHHAISLTLRESSGLVAENTSVEDDYDVDRRSVAFDTDADSLARFRAAPNQTLEGTASMAPGTTLHLELVPLDNPNATPVHTANATVDRNGEFNATIDLSNAPETALYTFRIPETPPRDRPYRLVAVGNATGASLGATDHGSIGTTLYANGVTTTHGGFLVAHNDTMRVALSDYFGPGAATPQPEYDPLLWQNETLTLTVYNDTDGTHEFDPAVDQPYQRAGDPVQVTVNVTVSVSDRESRTTTTPTTTSTTTSPTATTTGPTTTPDSTTEGNTDDTVSNQTTQSSNQSPVSTPGFGVGLVLLALLGVAGLAGRR